MFKKIIYLTLAFFMIIFLWTVNSVSTQLKGANNFEVFLYKNSSECKIERKNTFNFLKKGESYYLENSLNLNEILNYYDAELIETEETEYGTNYYAYSKNLKYIKKVKGKKINLHIFIGKNKTVIGTPFIFGSY